MPCGVVAQHVLDAAGVHVAPVTRGLDVKRSLAYVSSGQVDAAIVYGTDVRASGGRVVRVPIPSALNTSTTYEIGSLASTELAALDRSFEDLVLSPRGRSILAAAGFAPPRLAS